MTAKTLSLEVSDRGDVRLPRAYRRRYRVVRGERLRVVDVGGLLLLVPPAARLPGIQKRFVGACRRRRVTMKDLGGPERED